MPASVICSPFPHGGYVSVPASPAGRWPARCALWVDAASLPALPWHAPPTGRAYRRRVQRGGARHLGLPVPTVTPWPGWFCKAHATCLPTRDDHRSALQRKAHGPRGGVEGRLRVHMAVLIGCQMSADWHARLRLTALIIMTSRDGTVAKHSLAVRQCRGWWRAAREGRRLCTPPLHLR